MQGRSESDKQHNCVPFSSYLAVRAASKPSHGVTDNERGAKFPEDECGMFSFPAAILPKIARQERGTLDLLGGKRLTFLLLEEIPHY